MNAQQNTLASALVDLVETLTAEGEIAEVLQRLAHHNVRVLDVAASGVLCRDEQDRRPQHWLGATSDKAAGRMQRRETAAEQGPCLQCINTGKPVTCVGFEALLDCSPQLVGEAQRLGFRTVHALPMRARGQTVGGVCLYRTDTTPLSPEDLQAAQALADVVAAGIHKQRTLNRSEIRTKQLEAALDSRVVIEQAKGVIVSSCQLSPDEAFRLLRGHARSQQQSLKQLAAEVVVARNASPLLPLSNADATAEPSHPLVTTSAANENATVNQKYSTVLRSASDGDALGPRFPPGLGGHGSDMPNLHQTDRLSIESAGVGGWLYSGADRLGAFAAGIEQYAIIGLDPDGLIISWNPGAQRIKGYDGAEIIGRHFSVLYPPEKVAAGEPDAALRKAAAAGSCTSEGWRLRKDGTRFWAYVVIVALRSADGSVGGFTKLTRDETQARARQECAESRFANLFGFIPVGMALFAADQVLVEANDALTTLLGYERGQLEGSHLDRLLHGPDRAEGLVSRTAATGEVDVAYRLLVRADGRLVYCQLRSIPLQRDDGTTLRVVAFQPVTEHLREAEVLRNQATEDYLNRLPRGRGVSELLGHLLDRAEGAPPAGAAPETTGAAFQRINRAFGVSLASPFLIAAATRKVHAQHQLHQALAEGTLELRYQPLVATDGTVVSAEALVRWPHPDRGLLGPAAFLHLVRDGGFLAELDRWVLRTALREAAGWPTTDGQPISIAVNLSGLLPNDQGFADTISAIVTESGIDRPRVILEMVETAIVDQLTRCQRSMRALTQRGIRFAVDDFGTGHSSLARFQDLPVQIIKIDRRFVAGLGHTPVDLAVAKAIADMAHALDRQCVAEGVETTDQFQILAGLGVDTYQGWLFAKPMPQADFRALLTQRHGVIPLEPAAKPARTETHQ